MKFKNKKGKVFQLDNLHYFKVHEYKNKIVSVCMFKCDGWDGMNFISRKTFLTIQPHLTYLFYAHLHKYYKSIIPIEEAEGEKMIQSIADSFKWSVETY